jgi:uncharacterized protein
MSIADGVDATKVSIFVTHRCNLRCRYCYNGNSFERTMSWETARRAVDFAFDYAESTRGISGDGGPLILSFFGGEPSLARDVVEPLVDYAREQSSRRGRKLRFSLPTNGTLLDDHWLDFLVANEFRIQVSLDGARQAQNATRCFADGRSSWPDVSRNLARLSATPLEVIVVSIVDPRNVRFLAEGFPVLRQLGVRHLYYVPNLSATWSEADWDVLDQGLAALASQWADCLRSDQDVRIDPFHAKVQSHIRQGVAPATRCSFGKRELAISPRGRLYPCDRIVKADDDDTLCLGDLERGLDREKLAALARSREQVQPECAACALRSRCTSQCGCNNYEQTGDASRISPALCRWERAVIAAFDQVANTLFAESCPAFLERFYAAPLERLVPLRTRP